MGFNGFSFSIKRKNFWGVRHQLYRYIQSIFFVSDRN